jgi:hypothetical protein
MRIDSPKVSNLTFQSGSGVSDSAFTGSFSGSFTGVGNFTGLTADSVEYANILNRPNGLVSGSSAQARAQIGSVIGTDVQAYHENLNDISNLNPTDSTFIVGAGSSFVLESGNTVRTSLGLGSLAVLNTDATLSSVNLSSNSTYSFPNLTNLPTIFSGSDQVTGLANDQLTNSSISIDGSAISLGGSVTTLQLGSTNTTALAGNTRTISSTEIGNISDNNDKVTNVTTNLSITGTTGARTIVSSDGTDAVIPIATTSVSGVMSKAIFDEHVLNNAKETDVNHNVTTNLSITGTTGARTIVSSDGTNAVIPIATTSASGLLSPGLFDEIDANTAKVSNVTTNLSKTVSGTGFSINSSDGTNVALTLATTDNWGIMSDEMFDKLDGIETGATADQDLTSYQLKPSEGAFANGDKTKLDGIETGATADQDLSSYQVQPSEGAFVNGDKTKLDNIEAGATADQDLSSYQVQPSEGAFANGDKTKLDGIEANATADQSNAEIVAAVVASTSISNSNKGTIRSNIGVDAAGTDNSTDVSLGGSLDYVTLSGQVLTRNAINLSTDVTGTLPVSNMAATALTTVQTAANQTAHLALTAQEGDVVVRSDENKTYMHNGGTAGTMADYTLLATPTDAVTSVNGGTGVVTVTENVTTNLGITGTTGARTITSSDGTNAVIPVATDSVSGVMSATDHTKLTGIEANATADQDLSAYQLQPSEGAFVNGDKTKLDNIEAGATGDQDLSSYQVQPSEGAFGNGDKTKLDGIEENATADQTAADIRTLVGTGNSNFVPAAGSAGTFLAHDGVYRTPSYTTNTDTNTNQLTTWSLRDDDNDDVTIGQGKFIKFVAATGTLGTNTTGTGTSASPYIVTITSPDTTTNTQLSDAEVRAAVEAADDSNVFTDADHGKLDGIEENATADQDLSGYLTTSGKAADSEKLDGVDSTSFLRSDQADTFSGMLTGTAIVRTGAGVSPNESNASLNPNGIITAQSTNMALIEIDSSNDRLRVFTGGTGAGTLNFPTTGNTSYAWTLPLAEGTIALTSDITGTNSGTNTGDQSRGSLSIDTDDNVQFNALGIGTGASSTAGEIRAAGDITAYYSSDERLKENFAPLTGALDKVNAIGGYEFDWKDGIEDVVSKTGHDIGVKAQELQVQYPELVHERDNGYLAVDYIKLNAVLIEAVKELSAKVDKLENKCNC